MSRDLIAHKCSIKGSLYVVLYAGKDGMCIQITPEHLEYVQMTLEETKKFFQDCLNIIEELENPSKRRPEP